MTLISMKDVSLNRQGKTILSHLNWEVKPGESWVILGLNGSGKTSLLKLIMAEYWFSDGEMKVLDTHFGKGDITDLRTRIGVVGSFIAERLPKNMVTEKIVLTGKYKSSILYKEYGEKELEEARQMLRNLGAEHLIGRLYYNLSQGEKQLILIARSLMEDPEIIILDEATSGLDLFAREQLLKHVDHIRHLPHAPGLLYVTHHAEEITPTFSHVMLLKQGEITAAGKKEEILTEELLENFYDAPVSIVPIGNDRVYVNPDVTR